MKNAHTPGPWKVVPCPIHAGKHPCHDARWIMTADAEVEMSDYVPNDWALSQGSIVCQMRDGDPRDAHLIAAAPELLAALEGLGEASKTVIAQLEEATYEEGGQRLVGYISGVIVRQDDFQRLASFVEIARAAIAKARGGAR